MNKEDIRVQKTYKALTEAFFRLENKQKISKISINDICKESNIGRATFYRHFPNKDSFVRFIAKQWVDRFLSVSEFDLDEFLERRREILTRLVSSILSFLDNNPQVRVGMEEFDVMQMFLNTFQEKTYDLIIGYCKLKNIRPVHSPSILASAISGAFIQTSRWYIQSKDADFQEAVETTVELANAQLNVYFPE